MKKSLWELREKIIKASNCTDSHIIVAIDECHELMKYVPSGTDRSLLEFVAFAIYQCNSASVLGVLLSTNKLFSQVGFPQYVAPSSRELQQLPTGGNIRSPPWVALDFDGWTGAPIIEENTKTLLEVCTIAFLARFGRHL